MLIFQNHNTEVSPTLRIRHEVVRPNIVISLRELLVVSQMIGLKAQPPGDFVASQGTIDK